MKIREMVCRHEYNRRDTVCSVEGGITEFMNKCRKCGHIIHIRIANEQVMDAVEKIIEEQTV